MQETLQASVPGLQYGRASARNARLKAVGSCIAKYHVQLTSEMVCLHSRATFGLYNVVEISTQFSLSSWSSTVLPSACHLFVAQYTYFKAATGTSDI